MDPTSAPGGGHREEIACGFICPGCHRQFDSPEALTAHFEKEHEDPSQGGTQHRTQQQALSHTNLSVQSFQAPQFGYQPTCKTCHVSFGLSRARHHCRNCGAAACFAHSRNLLALPHIGYRTPVRVCDACFASILTDRQSEGVVRSGKLKRGSAVVMAQLNHLSLSIYGLVGGQAAAVGDSVSSAGKLVASMHLADIISIRRQPGSKSEFSIGDTEGVTLVLRADDEGECREWMHAIMQTKNDLLDAVRQLDLGHANREPLIHRVVVKDQALIGVHEVILTSDASFRVPVQLPYLTPTPDSEITLHLSGEDTVKLSGADLKRHAALEQKRLAEADAAVARTAADGSDETAVSAEEKHVEIEDDEHPESWVFATKLSTSALARKKLRVQVLVQADPVPCSVGVLRVLSLGKWLFGNTSAWSVDPEPASPLALQLQEWSSQHGVDFAAVLRCLGVALVAIALLRFQAMSLVASVEALFFTGLGTTCLMLSVILSKGASLETMAFRYTLALRGYSWEELALREELEAAEQLPVPRRFLSMVRGDMDQAKVFWGQTVAWRAAVRPHLALEKPRPDFELIKANLTHYYHKRDKTGRLVYYEALNAPRRAFRELARQGVSVDDVINHMVFMNEFCYNQLGTDYDQEGSEPTEAGQIIKIMDIQSLGLSDVGGHVSEYFKKIGLMGKNYPERIDKILVINVPAGFGMIWEIVAPMLDRNVRERISIFRQDYHEAMQELIDIDNIPAVYGGNCRCPGGECRFNSPEELRMKAWAQASHTPAEARPRVYCSQPDGESPTAESPTARPNTTEAPANARGSSAPGL